LAAKACAAINRLALARFKRYLCFLATLCANNAEHLAAVSAFAAFCLTLLTARLTAFRIVGVTLGCVEFLFTYGKGKCFPAVGTLKFSFLKCHWTPSFLK
jgi:hypothetical protein